MGFSTSSKVFLLPPTPSLTAAPPMYHSALKGAFVFPPSFVRVNFLLLLVITEPNWGRLDIQKRDRTDRQTESGIRCVGHSGGDTQPSLLLFSIFIL
jgi:hypothetical protein